jgi:hypothetical protein
MQQTRSVNALEAALVARRVPEPLPLIAARALLPWT